MITKPVNVPITALNLSALSAVFKLYAGGVLVYDLLDANGIIIARDRYSDPSTAPAVLTQAEIDSLVPVI